MPVKRAKLEYIKSQNISKPVVCSFPQNIPPQSFMDENSKLKLKFELFQHKKKGHDKTMIVGQNDIMEYSGKSYTHDNLDKKQTCDYMVGILDSETNKIKLVDVSHSYTLSQHAKNAKKYVPAQEHLFKGVEYYDHKHELVNVFGTKKAKQKMQQLKNNVVEEETINTEKQMSKVLKEDIMQLQQEEENKDEVIDPEAVLPKRNPDAQSPDEVFDREAILPHDIKEHIQFKDLYKMVKSDSEIEDKMYELYEWTTIQSMKYLVGQEKNNEKVKHLKYRVRGSIYMTYLIRFHKMPKIIKMSPKEVQAEWGIPKVIAERLLSTYAEITVASGDDKKKFHYSKTKKLQDRLLCHIVILMLTIYDYQIDVKWIINALRIEFTNLVKYLRIVNCTPKYVKAKKAEAEGLAEGEGDGDGEQKQKKSFKNEWALDKAGSLIVQFKVKNKNRKRAKQSPTKSLDSPMKSS